MRVTKGCGSMEYINSNIGILTKLKIKLRNFPILGFFLKKVWKFFKFIFFIHFFALIKSMRYRFKLPGTISLLQVYLQKVEYYQPLYNFPFIANKKPARACIDRADLIFEQIKSWGPGGRILDIGCSLGFFTYYFASRGYSAHGIDANADNISVCRLLQDVNNLPVTFSPQELSNEFVNKLSVNQYDIAFLFSLLHHVIHAKGLEYVQDLMSSLLDKIPILFVELALQDEEVDAPWHKSLPSDELAIFAKCSDMTIQKIGYVPNHLSSLRRPLYMIKKRVISLFGEKYSVYDRKFIAYTGVTYYGRQYYDCGDRYIKKYYLDESGNNYNQISREIENYLFLPSNHFFPRMISYHKCKNEIGIVFSKLPGDNLHELMLHGSSVPSLKILTDLINALDFLYQNGLYHNDVRLWNMMFDDYQTHLFDLGLAGKEEKENTNIALLWIIAQLYNFHCYDFVNPLIHAPKIELHRLESKTQDIVQALQSTRSFGEFLEWFKCFSL